jgi:hypothetical protein
MDSPDQERPSGGLLYKWFAFRNKWGIHLSGKQLSALQEGLLFDFSWLV